MDSTTAYSYLHFDLTGRTHNATSLQVHQELIVNKVYIDMQDVQKTMGLNKMTHSNTYYYKMQARYREEVLSGDLILSNLTYVQNSGRKRGRKAISFNLKRSNYYFF